jgi:hypothetical protein
LTALFRRLDIMDIDTVLESLRSKTRQPGRVVLFLGNGATMAAGGPSIGDLITAICDKFPNARRSAEGDFIEQCSAVLEVTGYDRKDLEDLICGKLQLLTPSNRHLQLPDFFWAAIFTTNYDDLIEFGYRNHPQPKQNPAPVYSSRPGYPRPDISTVKIFKLMGCVTRRHEEAPLALTRSDYNRTLRRRAGLFEILGDLAKDGTILFIGYSFRDQIAIDILDQIDDEFPKERRPWCYAAIPEVRPADDLYDRLIARKIVPLPLTFEQLFDELTKQEVPVPPTPADSTLDVTLRSGSTTFARKEYDHYRQFFEILTDQTVRSETRRDDTDAKRRFYSGSVEDWDGWIHGWDFHRHSYRELKRRLSSFPKSGDPQANTTFLVLGPAGVGKTIMLRRLALDWYTEERAPAIILPGYSADIDLQALTSASERLTHIAKPTAPDQRPRARSARLLVAIDRAPLLSNEVRRVAGYLKARGVPAVVVAFGRANEWEMATRSQPLPIPDDQIVHIEEAFESDTERSDFANHLIANGIAADIGLDEVVDLIRTRYHDSFFEALYGLVEPTRPTLEEKIRGEYTNLPEHAQQIYRMICALSQYDLPFPEEWLVRALGIGWDAFLLDVVDVYARGVVLEIEATPGQLYLVARNGVVASHIVARYVAIDGYLQSIMRTILSQCRDYNGNEVKICRALLTGPLASDGYEERLSTEEKTGLYEAVVETAQVRDSHILHHLGILLRDIDGPRAERSMLEALAVLHDDTVYPWLRREQEQFIHNSLGALYGRMARSMEQTGNSGQASTYYAQAVTQFRRARRGQFHNAYPYFSEAKMWEWRAQLAQADSDKLQHCTQALLVIDDAEDNLPPEEQVLLIELKSEIWQKLNSLPGLRDSLADLARTKPEVVAYLDVSQLLSSGRAAAEAAKDAEDKLRLILERSPDHSGCLRALANLHRIAWPSDKEGLLALLERRLQIPEARNNLDLLFEAGVVAFELGRRHAAFDYLTRLERESRNHPHRYGVRRRACDESGKDLTFRGQVLRITHEREGFIRADQVRPDRPVKFIPQWQRFAFAVGDWVEFKLAFNYRGILAVDLIGS